MGNKSDPKSNIKMFDSNMFQHYHLINAQIEDEIYLKNFSQSDDIDATIIHFNQVFVYYLSFIIFGSIFPLSYIVYYFLLLLEVYVDRHEFLFLTRRPSPQEMNSIGYFEYYLKVSPFLALFFIAYNLSFYAFRLTINVNYLYIVFVLLCIFGFLIYQLLYAINPKGTMRTTNLIERQKTIGRWQANKRAED